MFGAKKGQIFTIFLFLNLELSFGYDFTLDYDIFWLSSKNSHEIQKGINYVNAALTKLFLKLYIFNIHVDLFRIFPFYAYLIILSITSILDLPLDQDQI